MYCENKWFAYIPRPLRNTSGVNPVQCLKARMNARFGITRLDRDLLDTGLWVAKMVNRDIPPDLGLDDMETGTFTTEATA